MTEVDTSEIVPPQVQFVCSLCKVTIVTARQQHGVAECFVWVRRLEKADLLGAPTYPTQCAPEEVMNWFTVEPRCRRHVASHQRPLIPYAEGKVLAWKCLSEETRRLIVVKGILDS